MDTAWNSRQMPMFIDLKGLCRECIIEQYVTTGPVFHFSALQMTHLVGVGVGSGAHYSFNAITSY